VDLVLEARALAHELRAARKPAAQGARLFARQPGAREHAGGQQLRQGARIELGWSAASLDCCFGK
jgi:hypothetical protein